MNKTEQLFNIGVLKPELYRQEIRRVNGKILREGGTGYSVFEQVHITMLVSLERAIARFDQCIIDHAPAMKNALGDLQAKMYTKYSNLAEFAALAMADSYSYLEPLKPIVFDRIEAYNRLIPDGDNSAYNDLRALADAQADISVFDAVGGRPEGMADHLVWFADNWKRVQKSPRGTKLAAKLDGLEKRFRFDVERHLITASDVILIENLFNTYKDETNAFRIYLNNLVQRRNKEIRGFNIKN